MKWSQIETVAERDEYIEYLWDKFQKLDIDPNTKRICSEFIGFPAGTAKTEIIDWFNKVHSKGALYLQNGILIDFARNRQKCDIWVMHEETKEIHRVGDKETDSIMVSNGIVKFFDTATGDGIMDDGSGGYKFLDTDSGYVCPSCMWDFTRKDKNSHCNNCDGLDMFLYYEKSKEEVE